VVWKRERRKSREGLFAVGMAGTGAAIGERRAIWRTSLALVLLKPLGRFGYRLPFLRCPAVVLDVLRVPSTKDRAANRPIQTASGFGAHKPARG
jgi:hypothetical protein